MTYRLDLLGGAALLAMAGVAMACAGGGDVESSGSGGEGPKGGAGGGVHGGPTGSGSGTGGGGAGVVINDGYIGGPCASDADCAYDGGVCLEGAGFPGGMCSLDCDLYCPDQDGFVTTFCVHRDELGLSGDPGLCTIHCDFGASPTGCRDGYSCVEAPRYMDEGTEAYVCVPGDAQAPVPATECQQELAARGIWFEPTANPMDHPDGAPDLTCDVEDAVYVSPVMRGVTYHEAAFDATPVATFAACKLALALDDAAGVFQSLGVTDVEHLGVYNCRFIAGSDTLSQHAFANAIDIAGVLTTEGKTFTVEFDYEKDTPNPTTEGGILLRTVAETFYDQQIFNIILTPDYNADHYNHFHCDLTPGASFFQ